MNTFDQNVFLRNNTGVFVRSVCGVILDMVNIQFTIEQRNKLSCPLSFRNGLVVISHFSGEIQGDFMLATDELTAAKLVGVFSPDPADVRSVKHRETYSSFMCEVLNVSANHALGSISRDVGRIMLLPPAWVFGEYYMADYVSGVGIIDSLYGTIQCSLALNMVSLGKTG